MSAPEGSLAGTGGPLAGTGGPLARDRVDRSLERLGLGQLPGALDGIAEAAARREATYVEFLDDLLAVEVDARASRDVAMKARLAHFPVPRTLEQFDFAAQPGVSERQVRELAALRWVARGENLVLLGPPGTGKTHLAIALGTCAIAQGVSTYFTTVADLLETLDRDRKEDRVAHRLRTLCRPRLLILDEMGYFPLDHLAARFLFQLVSRRYQRASIVLTSNKRFGEWGDVFEDQVLASAILDRLLHASTTLVIRGESYRLREKRRSGAFPDLALPDDAQGGPAPDPGGKEAGRPVRRQRP